LVSAQKVKFPLSKAFEICTQGQGSGKSSLISNLITFSIMELFPLFTLARRGGGGIHVLWTHSSGFLNSKLKKVKKEIT
jgi:Na+-driven multidrug efflux pump